MSYNHIPTGYKLRKLILTLGRISKSIFINNKSYLKNSIAGTKDGLKYLFSITNFKTHIK